MIKNNVLFELEEPVFAKPDYDMLDGIVMEDSTNAATSNINATIPISSAVFLISFFNGFFLTITIRRNKLLDIAIPYDTTSITPKGVESKIITGLDCDNTEFSESRILNAAPVDQALYIPHPTPAAGTNMPSVLDILCTNMPNGPIPCVDVRYSFRNWRASSFDIL